MDTVKPPGKPLLEIRDLRTHFVTRAGVVKAVNGVSFSVMPGETLGLVGESGSGKTVTCLSILKLLPRGARIASGQVLFEGEDLLVKSEPEMEAVRGKRIGLILQNSLAALDPVFTIGVQVAEPLVVHQQLTWKAAFRRAVDLLRMVRIGAPELRIKNYPHELSGGMRQRAASAAAIGPLPSLLIADEAATGIAIIFVTHDMSIIGNLCDRVAVFYGGLAVEEGPKDRVFAEPAHPYTAALLRAVPILGQKVERLQSIRGEPPNLASLPAGCPFHPRCEQAMDICQRGEPPPRFVLPDLRHAGCWLREQEHVGTPLSRPQLN